jgi:hypothetical protein
MAPSPQTLDPWTPDPRTPDLRTPDPRTPAHGPRPFVTFVFRVFYNPMMIAVKFRDDQ